MKELFQKHYEAIKKRGKINENTTNVDFIEKLMEEVTEWIIDPSPQEAMDIICVMSNWLQENNYDIEDELRINLNFQLNRND